MYVCVCRFLSKDFMCIRDKNLIAFHRQPSQTINHNSFNCIRPIAISKYSLVISRAEPELIRRAPKLLKLASLSMPLKLCVLQMKIHSTLCHFLINMTSRDWVMNRDSLFSSDF